MAAPKKTKNDSEEIPTQEKARAVYAPLANNTNFQARMNLLVQNPPQVIHIEGGLTHERLAMAYYWAAVHNCEDPQNSPCLKCSTCIRTAVGIHPDVIVFDGREDSIKIEEMRALKPIIGEKPRFANKRVILLLEAQALTIAAANSLLKMLEEPNSHTLFLFTVSQRAKLLPTILSRGFILTLPWPALHANSNSLNDIDTKGQLENHSTQEWNQALATFLQNGTGWFSKTSNKTEINREVALQIILIIQKALSNKMAQRNQTPLDAQMQKLPVHAIQNISEILEQAQDSLNYETSPALVLDALATELFTYFK